jgi:hypothetical protein
MLSEGAIQLIRMQSEPNPYRILRRYLKLHIIRTTKVSSGESFAERRPCRDTHPYICTSIEYLESCWWQDRVGERFAVMCLKFNLKGLGCWLVEWMCEAVDTAMLSWPIRLCIGTNEDVVASAMQARSSTAVFEATCYTLRDPTEERGCGNGASHWNADLEVWSRFQRIHKNPRVDSTIKGCRSVPSLNKATRKMSTSSGASQASKCSPALQNKSTAFSL